MMHDKQEAHPVSVVCFSMQPFRQTWGMLRLPDAFTQHHKPHPTPLGPEGKKGGKEGRREGGKEEGRRKKNGRKEGGKKERHRVRYNRTPQAFARLRQNDYSLAALEHTGYSSSLRRPTAPKQTETTPKMADGSALPPVRTAAQATHGICQQWKEPSHNKLFTAPPTACRPGSSIRNFLVHRTFRFPASSQTRRERCGIECRSALPFCRFGCTALYRRANPPRQCLLRYSETPSPVALIASLP